MAEFDNETASLDLFQEFLNQRSLDETADNVSVNNVVDSNVNKHSSNGNFIKPSLASNIIDDEIGGLIKTEEIDELKTENVVENAQDSVMLNNIENLKKTDFKSTTVNRVDNKRDFVEDDNVEEHNNVVNGNEDTVLKCDDKICGKQKKGISFPKGTFISGYFEPPDPWKNAPSWTTEELVSAYKKSCEQHGTKPIAKLLQQLQTCIPGRQEDLLSLKGEKLDQKQCECLEEVLRRVQFKVIDLEASHLDDECAVAVFDMIEYYESACQLNISFNKNIQARAWQACSRLVRRTPNLTHLDLRSCDLNDRTIPIFGRALKLGCHLTVLHMEGMNLSGRPLVILVAALKMNETLQELFLAENKLMPTDGVQLGNLLHYNRKLSLLDLRNNHLQDAGTSHISDGLLEQGKGPGLRILVLWNNAINYQAMPALGRTLAANESLETLNIGHNALTNEGVHLLKDGLLKTNSLLRLGLQGTRITDEGAVALAEYIADSTILLRIDLRDNDIKTGGLMALSHAMRVNTSVTRIDLDKDPKKESSIKDYAEQQSHLLRDIYTFQQRNIQTALQKEEKERAELEQKARAVSIDSQEHPECDEVAESSQADYDSSQPFSLFDKEEQVEDNDLTHEKDKKDAENAKAKSIGEKFRESQTESIDSEQDETDSSSPLEDFKSRQRPSILFPYMGLPPQAALDSPLPTSEVSPLVSVLSEFVSTPPPQQPPPTSQKGLLTLNMGSAPGEMILSPQYFPKQIARKIFSVSRVSEDQSCTQLSTSPTPTNPLAAAFDPLNVSPIPLIPVSSSSSSSIPPSSSPLLVPQCALGATEHSKPALQTSVSPSSSLFQDLAAETVKHLVSPIMDINVKSLLDQNIELENVPNNDPCIVNQLLHTDVFFEAKASNPTALAPQNKADICDNPEISAVEAEYKNVTSTFIENLCDSNSVCKNVAMNSSNKEDKNVIGLENGGTLPQDLFIIPENASDKLSQKNSLEPMQEADFLVSSNDINSENFSTVIQDSDVLTGIPDIDLSENKTGMNLDSQLSDDSVFVVEESATSCSELGNNMVAFLNMGAGDDVMQSKGVLEKEELSQQKMQHQDPDSFVVHSSLHSLDIEVFQSSAVIDNIAEDLLSVSLNNSNNFSFLESSEDTRELSAVSPGEDSETSLFKASYTEEQPSSSSGYLGELGVDASSSIEGTAEVLLETKKETLETDCSGSDSTNALKPSSDSIDNENVALSLDEEPWLAVAAENDRNSSSSLEKSKESSSTQPDFFTTLSMNGLTQELASALTTLDGSNTSYENDEDLDLRPHDEFEKELDAMLAIVQSDRPWPLKDS